MDRSVYVLATVNSHDKSELSSFTHTEQERRQHLKYGYMLKVTQGHLQCKHLIQYVQIPLHLLYSSYVPSYVISTTRQILVVEKLQTFRLALDMDIHGYQS